MPGGPASWPADASGSLSLRLETEAATAALAHSLAALAQPRDCLCLTGDLGAGKTAFARAFIQARAALEGAPALAAEVPSPTFTLVQIYDLPSGAVWHFDLYRVSNPEEIWELGFEEALAAGLLLIEWPERLGRLKPTDHLGLRLFHDQTSQSGTSQSGTSQEEEGQAERRLAILDAQGPHSQTRLAALTACLASLSREDLVLVSNLGPETCR